MLITFHTVIFLVLVASDGLLATINNIVLLAHHRADPVVGGDFVDDCGYDLIETPTFRIVSGCDKIRACGL